ncbi:MAG: ceramidase domain-containing protein [Sphingorhabdus sp.]
MTIRMATLFNAAILTALGAAAILFLLWLAGPDWSIYAPASCTATRCFCELPRSGSLIVQPANSWSSLGFTFAGFLMILNARGRGWASAFPPSAAYVYGASAIFVGLGSVLLHATLTLWGQFFDVVGMYLVSAFMAVAALTKWQRLPGRTAVVLYLALCVILISLLIGIPEVRRWLFAVVLVTAIILELGFARPLRRGIRPRLYLYGMATNAVAFTIWNLDQNGQLCAPESLFQGHAVWHILGAVALWFSYLYYRSERAG